MKTKEKEAPAAPLLVTTTDTLPQPHRPLGMVSGTAKAGAGFGVTDRVDRAAAVATAEMVEQARAMGGQAVIGVRFALSNGQVLVSGTAVVLG